MINIAICDDDKVILSEIKNLLLNIAEKNFIKIDVNTYYDGSSLEKDINKGEVFDLLYLDIEMSQNGILTAKRLRERGYDVLIIYISSYEKYFRELFEVNTFRFLGKPIDKQKCQKYLLEAVELINRNKKYLENLGQEENYCLTVDCYPGVDDEIFDLIKEIYKPDFVIKSEDVFYEKDELNKMMNPFLTENRVRGVMYYGKMDDFIDDIKLAQYQSLASHKGRVLVYGVGASYIHKGDTLIYCDLARWKIQLRYRKGMPNFKQDNDDEDVLKKIKRNFFIEWRIADKHKMDIFENIDYFLDSNQEGNPKIVTGNALRSALKKTTQRPFRLVPYFDPGVWGGQWMKKNCDLDEKQNNYAWSFDGVPEENSLYFRFGDTRIEIPAMD